MPSYARQVSEALGAAFMLGPWTQAALVGLGERTLGERPPWLSGAVRRLLRSLPQMPEGDEAVTLVGSALRDHPGFRRACTDPDTRPRVRRWIPRPPPQMGQGPWPVPPLSTNLELATHLSLGPEELAWFADPRGVLRRTRNPRLHHYHRSWIPKRTGGFRLVERPKTRMKATQRRLLRSLFDLIPPHDAAHGFVAGRSAITHAAGHAGRAVVLRLDLEDFFTAVRHAQVHRLCRHAGYPEEVARLLAGLCTTSLPPAMLQAMPRPQTEADLPHHQRQRRRLVRRHLPQGAPTSPALANLVAWRLDRRLSLAAESVSAHYSRYADDLVFSGDAAFARRASRFVGLAAAIAIEEGFAVQFRKTRVMRRGQRQEVAGIVVNERPNIARRDYERLEATLTNCRRHGPTTQNREGHADFRAHLRGKVAWAQAVCPKRGHQLLTLFEAIDWTEQ